MKFLENLKKFGKTVAETPPAQDLKGSFDRDPVKTVGVGTAIAAGTAVLGVAAMEMSQEHDLLTPEGVSYSELAPEIPGEKVENVKLEEKAQDVPSGTVEPKL